MFAIAPSVRLITALPKGGGTRTAGQRADRQDGAPQYNKERRSPISREDRDRQHLHHRRPTHPRSGGPTTS